MSHDEELHARGYDHGLMRRLLAYLKPYRGQVAFAAVVVLADAVLGLGATKHDHQPGTSFRVFLDPAGHPFCLCLD